MKHLTAVILNRDVSVVTRELLRLGLLHFVSAGELDPKLAEKLAVITPDSSIPRISEQRRRIESLLGLAGITPSGSVRLQAEELGPIDPAKLDLTLEEITGKIEVLREQQKALQSEILKLEDINRRIDIFGSAKSIARANTRISLLSVKTGSVPDGNIEGLIEGLAELPSILLRQGTDSGRTDVLVIAMKKDIARVEGTLGALGWQNTELASEFESEPEIVSKELAAKKARLEESQNTLAAKSRNIVAEHAETLLMMWKKTRLSELAGRIQSHYGKTSKTVMISGWLPASRCPLVEEAVARVSDNRCYIEWNDPEGLSKKTGKRPIVPVRFSSPVFLSPFQMLIKNYAMPEYGVIDPTIIVTVLYVIMFGLMFADAGQGLIIALLGIAGVILFRKSNPDAGRLSSLIVWCGSSAAVFGWLFGSYMGYQIIPPVWFDYHSAVSGHGSGFFKDVYSILLITVLFGIAVIWLGLAMNWINLIRKRDWASLFIDKRGLLGAYMYAGGIYIALYMVDHGFKELPPIGYLIILAGVPSLVFMLKHPVEYFLHRKKHPEKKFPAMFFLEWFVEMLEIYSGYLSNTLSFMRVAALGIGHVSLMTVFFTLAKMADSSGIPGAGIVVLVFGHAIVIGLEGLSAGIQSLRLNYYEFFSKFFTGAGIPYSPVTLESKI